MTAKKQWLTYASFLISFQSSNFSCPFRKSATAFLLSSLSFCSSFLFSSLVFTSSSIFLFSAFKLASSYANSSSYSSLLSLTLLFGLPPFYFSYSSFFSLSFSALSSLINLSVQLSFTTGLFFIFLAWSAYLKVDKVSSQLSSAGEMAQIIIV